MKKMFPRLLSPWEMANFKYHAQFLFVCAIKSYHRHDKSEKLIHIGDARQDLGKVNRLASPLARTPYFCSGRCTVSSITLRGKTLWCSWRCKLWPLTMTFRVSSSTPIVPPALMSSTYIPSYQPPLSTPYQPVSCNPPPPTPLPLSHKSIGMTG